MRRFLARGYRYVRAQITIPGLNGYGGMGGGRGKGKAAAATSDAAALKPFPNGVWEPRPYVTIVPKLFEHLRKKLG